MIQLRDYQIRISDQAVQLLHKYGLCYLSMECRTGKSITALSAADKFGARSVLFITKLKAVPSIKSDYEGLRPNAHVEVINYESCHKCSGKYDLIILDEAHSLGAYPKPSQRTKVVKNLCGDLPVIFLSGTPSPESYSQLFHQFWVSGNSPWKKHINFYKWARAGYVNVQEKWINGYRINDYSYSVKSMIDRDIKHLFISYSQEDAGFESSIIEQSLTVEMKAHTRVFIEKMERDKVIYINDEAVLGDSPAKLLSKLHQLSSGTVITENGLHFTLDKSKAEFIRDNFIGQKTAIFYVFQSELDLLKEVFPNWTDNPEEFQNKDDKTFICQVRRAREGVRLDSADALIFFNLEYSYLSYEQGRNRLISKERTEPAKVYFLVSDCGVEKGVLEAVHGKQDFTYSYYRSKKRPIDINPMMDYNGYMADRYGMYEP